MVGYSPQYGNWGPANVGPPPFGLGQFDSLSVSMTPIELLSNDGKDSTISHATGFFWSKDGRSFLVSNYHVFSGRDVFSDEILSDQGFVPRRIRYFEPVSHAKADGGIRFDRVERVIDVVIDDAAIWRTGTDQAGNRVDVAAVEIASIHKAGLNLHVNGYGYQSLFSFVGADIFVVGYPLRHYVGAMPGIWKRGALASEPLIPVDDRPIFLIDAATATGMSGAPVFRRVFGPAPIPINGQLNVQATNIVTTEFVGVYGGRLLDGRAEGVNLGYCWYGSSVSRLIDEM